MTGCRQADERRTAYDRAMNRYARAERRSLADLMRQLGPDAPTLCTGWTTRDLAAHVVVRERRPDAAAGIVVPPLRGHGERVRTGTAGGDYAALVDRVGNPPWWSLISNPLLDEAVNGMEFFIHHEDVRRAQPGWEPRRLPADQEAALWRRAAGLAKFALRRFRASVLLQAPGHGEQRAGAGGPAVRVIGAPGELVLFLSGRQRAARVQVDGPPEVTEKLRNARLGL
jgi:uncharacterized protein (TIGR03085 family)